MYNPGNKLNISIGEVYATRIESTIKQEAAKRQPPFLNRRKPVLLLYNSQYFTVTELQQVYTMGVS